MTNRFWIDRSLDEIHIEEKYRKCAIFFWDNFYGIVESGGDDVCNNIKGKHSEYKDEVIEILEEGKNRFPLSNRELRDMQQKIESITMKFDECCIYKTEPNNIKMLIREKEGSAKDSILRNAKLDKLESEELLA